MAQRCERPWRARNAEHAIVYRMNLKEDRIQMGGGVRHIAQTVFAPD
jgi:hypothetical protein